MQPQRLSLPDSIAHLHHNFAHHHAFSFLNILSTFFCRMFSPFFSPYVIWTIITNL